MPGGLSWPRYICFVAAATLTTMAGSQTVHNIYRPLDDLEDLVEDALKQRLAQK